MLERFFRRFKQTNIGTCGRNGTVDVVYSFRGQFVWARGSERYCGNIRDYEQAIAWCKKHLPNFVEV